MTATSSLLPLVVEAAAAASVLVSEDAPADAFGALVFDSMEDFPGVEDGSWLQPAKASAAMTGNKSVFKTFMDRDKCHNIWHLSSPHCLTANERLKDEVGR